MNQELRVRRRIRAHIVHNENTALLGTKSAQYRYRRTPLGQEAARRAVERKRSWDKILALVEAEGRG